MVMAIGASYVPYGTLPAMERILYGVKPVVIAVIMQALLGLVRAAIKTSFLGVLTVLALALEIAGLHSLLLLLLPGFAASGATSFASRSAPVGLSAFSIGTASVGPLQR